MQIDPRFLAQNPATGFQIPIPPGQNLVPYQTQPFTAGLGGIPDAVTAGEPAAEALGRLARLRLAATSPLGLAGLGLGAALYADPGSGKHFDPFLGIDPNDQSDDLGITSIGKSAMRGTAHIGNKIKEGVDYIGENSPLKYLTTTNADRTVPEIKPEESPMLTGLDDPVEASPSSGITIPGSGGSAGTDSALDDLLKVVAASRPEKGQISQELKDSMRAFSQAEAAASASRDTLGGATRFTPMLDMIAARNKSNLQEQLQGLAAEQSYTKNMKDWLETYAKTGVDVAKEKRAESKDDFKIHASKDGFLIESRDKNGNVSLKPISPFGTSGKIEVNGQKFTGSNPLKEELGVLQNLGNIGALNDIMVEHSRDLMKATKGIADPKLAEQAKILTLARAMHNNPNFKAAMIQKYVDSMGQSPQGAEVTQPVNIDDNKDWLSQLAP